jgi:hypothetical protein
MKSTGKIGMKITGAQREYFRYTGISAELERRGMGCSRAELPWANRVRQQAQERRSAGLPGEDRSAPDQSNEKSRK